MKHTTWLFLCIPLFWGLGCGSSRIAKVPTEPNIPQEKPDISVMRTPPDVKPNIPTEPAIFVLSGSLGVGNVRLKGLPGEPNSLANGTYQATIPAGWSGTVTPEKEGFSFIPPSRSYAPFIQDIRHEIYIPQKLTSPAIGSKQTTERSDFQTLTGTLQINGAPIQGIVLRTLATAATAVTDAKGCFSLNVPSGWKGTLRLEPPSPTIAAVPEQAPVAVNEMQVKMADRPSEPLASDVPESETPTREPSCITLGTSSLSQQATEELHHDLQVMCQLLSQEALGQSLVKRNPKTEPRAIYIPGDGVLFDIGIDWPLADQPLEPNRPAQSAQWQKASDYMDRQGKTQDVLERLHHIKTEAFIQKMTHCLKHASYIRHVQADNSITLHIWGPSPSKELAIRTPKRVIDDYAGAILTDGAFEKQVALKLH